MNRNTHDHITNRIWKRSNYKLDDGLYVELEEGSRVSHLNLPMRLRDFATSQVSVKAIVSGSAPLLRLLPQKQKDLVLKQLLLRSGADIVSADDGGIDYAASILKTLSGWYPQKHSVNWFSFYVYSVCDVAQEEHDFDLHRHVGVIEIDLEDFKKIKEGEAGIALNVGIWTYDYDGQTEVVDDSGYKIGSAQTILAFCTRQSYLPVLMPVINTLEIVEKAEKELLSKKYVIKRVAELSNRGKSDADWLSLVFYMPESVDFKVMVRLLSEKQK
jgi:hypothetical protein